jgi:hypothetical protein
VAALPTDRARLASATDIPPGLGLDRARLIREGKVAADTEVPEEATMEESAAGRQDLDE